jgi:hypothetical protein
LRDSSVSGPTASEDTSIGYRDGEDSISEASHALSVPSVSCGLLSVASLSPRETIDHSDGLRKMKMSLHSTEPVIMIEKRIPERLETDKDDNLLFCLTLNIFLSDN